MTDFTEPSGKCDVCKVRPATQWFGETSCATCDDPTKLTETTTDGCYTNRTGR